MIDNYILSGCAGSAHAQIRQLANWPIIMVEFDTLMHYGFQRQRNCENPVLVKFKMALAPKVSIFK